MAVKPAVEGAEHGEDFHADTLLTVDNLYRTRYTLPGEVLIDYYSAGGGGTRSFDAPDTGNVCFGPDSGGPGRPRLADLHAGFRAKTRSRPTEIDRVGKYFASGTAES